MKVIGFRKSSLKGNDGTEVSGVNLYLTDKCEKGEGLSCDRIYVMDKILASCGYTPKLNDEVSSSITAGASLRHPSGQVLKRSFFPQLIDTLENPSVKERSPV